MSAAGPKRTWRAGRTMWRHKPSQWHNPERPGTIKFVLGRLAPARGAATVLVACALALAMSSCAAGALEDHAGLYPESGFIGEWRYDRANDHPMVVFEPKGRVRFESEIYLSPNEEETGGQHVKGSTSYLRMLGPRRAETTREIGPDGTNIVFDITESGELRITFGSGAGTDMVRIGE